MKKQPWILGFALTLLLACSGTTTDEDFNVVTFSDVKITPINATQLNIAWNNPDIQDSFTISVQMRDTDSPDPLEEITTLTNIDTPEVQIPGTDPETNYEIQLVATLSDGEIIESDLFTITTPIIQTGNYSAPNYTNFSSDILTTSTQWTWNHPALPTALLTEILIQRKSASEPYWKTMQTLEFTATDYQDASLELFHNQQYEYRMITLFEDETTNVDVFPTIFSLNTTLPLISAIEVVLDNTNFPLDQYLSNNILGLYKFDILIQTDAPYTISDIIEKIGPVNIQPYVNITNNLMGTQSSMPLEASTKVYASNILHYVSSVQFQNEFGLNYVGGFYENAWTNFTMQFYIGVEPLDPLFPPQAYPSVTKNVQCSYYYCYNSF